ncbi:MAG: hypothetical protein AAGA18_05095 [Verrucomicrobiota bacterium]
MPEMTQSHSSDKSANRLIEFARIELEEHTLAIRWSPTGNLLAAMPSEGSIIVLDVAEGSKCSLKGHGSDNASLAWHPKRNLLATCGQDGMIRIYGETLPFTKPIIEFLAGKGWIETLAWNCDGSLLAVGVDRTLLIFDPQSGEITQSFNSHRSTICDLAWNPIRRDEIATVCDGGANMWRIGEKKPFGKFEWGGASLKVLWSPDGRWVVTGDQLPSVHIYDVPKQIPLHIQGYQGKVRALTWEDRSEWLATAGGNSVTVWPCTGNKGPDGATPIELLGHEGKVCALHFAPGQTILASGDDEGVLLLWLPKNQTSPAQLILLQSSITDIKFSPDSTYLSIGTTEGIVSIRTIVRNDK